MIIAIERSKFIYLYKYNEISVDANQIIDLSVEKIIKSLKDNNQKIINDFDRILPIFEQDHEVILLEIDKNNISVGSEIVIYFKAVLSIYPLTNIGSQLLQGKINDNFIINNPVFENIIEEVKIIRTLENRKLAVKNILELFSLNIDSQQVILIDQVLKRILLSTNSTNNFNSYLDYLISYNKTPSNIPDGNVEFLCKIGVIVFNYLQKEEANFYKGPFYKSCLNYSNEINIGNIFNSYSTFIDIQDNELLSSLEKLKSNININIPNIDIFKASYFFLAYKAFLNKNDKNIELLKTEIDQLIFDDEQTAAFTLAMIGYVFSFELLYESLHTLNKSPLIRTSLNQSFLHNTLVVDTKKKVKKVEAIIVENTKDFDNDTKKDFVSEDISVPIVVYESNINKDERDKADLTLFAMNDNSFNKNEIVADEEITKSVPDLIYWLGNHKTISKNSISEWKKFIEKSLKYGNHSFNDILKKIATERLESKLTKKMIKELEKFFT